MGFIDRKLGQLLVASLAGVLTTTDNHLQNEIMLVIMANYILLVLFGISNTLYADQDVGGSNSTGRRHRRGLYGSEVTGGFCPSECLCLSEIQVNIETEKMNSTYYLSIS